ncbi:MAG TPA: hypothetical protein VN657_01700, partial [Nitrospiraceae bacterium]|nr:hypothetical protein [Nitrospiraceae bacterium]
HVGLALEQHGLRTEALQIWEDVLGHTNGTPVNERTLLTKIQQRATQLRAQLMVQDRGVNPAPISISSDIQSSVAQEAH